MRLESGESAYVAGFLKRLEFPIRYNTDDTISYIDTHNHAILIDIYDNTKYAIICSPDMKHSVHIKLRTSFQKRTQEKLIAELSELFTHSLIYSKTIEAFRDLQSYLIVHLPSLLPGFNIKVTFRRLPHTNEFLCINVNNSPPDSDEISNRDIEFEVNINNDFTLRAWTYVDMQYVSNQTIPYPTMAIQTSMYMSRVIDFINYWMPKIKEKYDV